MEDFCILSYGIVEIDVKVRHVHLCVGYVIDIYSRRKGKAMIKEEMCVDEVD